MSKIRIALTGCGAIAHGMHLPGIKSMEEMGLVDLVALCDVMPEKVQETAERFGVSQTFTDFDQMLAQADFDLLVNTTVIPAHFAVTLAAMQAGKHVYTQKPMATTLEEATILVTEANRLNVRLAVAPEHRVRPHVRKMAELIEQGAIGKVAFAKIQTSHHGPEKHAIANSARDSSWFYKAGSNPILDLGVHGLSQITSILGPVRRLTALSGRTSPVRHFTEGPFKGNRIDVEIDDNSLLLLDFGDATFAFLDATYCVPASMAPRLEIFGSDGTLAVVMQMVEGRLETHLHLYRAEEKSWHEVEMEPASPVRDLGVLHLVESMLAGEPHLLTGEHGRHLVEIMTLAPVAAQEGRAVEIESRF